MGGAYFIKKTLLNKKRGALAVAGVAVIVIAVIFLFAWRDPVARLLWRETNRFVIPYFLVSSDADLLIEMGDAYFNGEQGYDLNRAYAAYKKAARIEPNKFIAHYNMARVLAVTGPPWEALNALAKAERADPTYAQLYYMRGLVNTFNGSLERAEEEFREFVRRAPLAWAGYNDLAWVLLRQGKFQEAEEAARLGLKKTQPQNPWLLNNLGVALLNQKKLGEAEEALRAALLAGEETTTEDWRRAYPGNDASLVSQFKKAFLASVYQNLALIFEARGEEKNAARMRQKADLLEGA